jgi:O-antigen/teichoic acid export membrane protein
MERSKRFFNAVASGYASVVVLSLLNLVSVPFALWALGREGFGVAATVLQIMAFSQVLQMGVGPSVARFIVDYNCQDDDRRLASFVKTAFFIGLCQGALLLVLALLFTSQLGQLFNIPGDFRVRFEVVVFWCLTSSALSIALNPVQQLLYASQRMDVINYIAIATQTSGTAVLVVLFWLGHGLFSYVVCAWVVTLSGAALAWVWCGRLGLMPSLRGAPLDLAAIVPLGRFSASVMMISLGLQVIAIAPAVVINRLLGVGAMGDWSIGTKLLQLGQQLVGRISNAAEPTLWDIYSRGDKARCRARLVQTSWLAATMGTFLGALLVSLNGNFVRLWSGGLVSWPMVNDLLGAALLWVTAFSATWSMLPGITKRLRNARFVPVLEGLLVLALLIAPSVTTRLAVVLAGMLASMVFVRFAYGALRMVRDLDETPATLLRLIFRPFAFWVAAMLVALAVRSSVGDNSAWLVLIFWGALCCAVYAVMAYLLALTSAMKYELLRVIRQRCGLV